MSFLFYNGYDITSLKTDSFNKSEEKGKIR